MVCFADEIWPEKSKFHDKNYVWVSCLLCRAEDAPQISRKLKNYRYDTCNYQLVGDSYPDLEKKDEKIKFRKADSNNKYEVADRWIQMLREDPDVSGKLKAKVVGIDMDKINKENFGEEGDVESRVYAWALKTALDGSSEYFFAGDKIEECVLYQHQGNQCSEDNFEDIVKSTKNLDVREIKYYDDDHRKHRKEDIDGYNAANFLQLCDVLAGSVSKLYTKEYLGPRKKSLVLQVKELIKEGTEDPVFKYADVSFFPKEDWDGIEKQYTFHEREMKR